MTTKISARVGGLGRDARAKFELFDNATVQVGNGTSTGNVYVGKDVVSGNAVIAATFFGSGASLTGINASVVGLDNHNLISANANGTVGFANVDVHSNVAASFFIGDGSQLTNIGGVAANPSVTLADDRDFGTLTSANVDTVDAFSQSVGGVDLLDLLDEPASSLATLNLGALS